jgi:lysophospholipase L1-like esterase
MTAVAVGVCLLILIEGALRLAGIGAASGDPFAGFVSGYKLFMLKERHDGSRQYVTSPARVNRSGELTVKRGQYKDHVIMLPGFRPEFFSAPKKEQTCRIFCFGGSTTFGFRVGQKETFAAVLEDSLNQMSRGARYEVVNVGCPGFASYRILILMKEIADYEPDIFVVCTGHNEFLEKRIYMASGMEVRSPRVQALQERLNRLRLYTLVKSGMTGVASFLGVYSADTAISDRIQVSDPMNLDPGEREQMAPPQREAVYARFLSNLAEMTRFCEKRGIGILFITPCSNLLYPPFLSGHPPGFEQEEAFSRAFNRGKKHLASGALKPAAAAFSEALEIDPGYAECHYLLARCAAGLGRMTEAEAAYRRAVDHDLRLHRMPERFRRAQIEYGRREGIPLVDAEALFFRTRTPADPFASRLFLDHCHPTPAGHRLLGRAAAKKLINH